MRILLLFLLFVSCSEKTVQDSVFIEREESGQCLYEIYNPQDNKSTLLEKLGKCVVSMVVDRVNQQVYYSLEQNIVEKDLRTQKVKNFKLPKNDENGFRSSNRSIVLWISPSNDLYFARTVFVEEEKVKIVKTTNSESWLVNYQGKALSYDLVIGSPVIYEVQKLNKKKG